MLKRSLFLCLGLALVAARPAAAADTVPDGTYRVSYLTGTAQNTNWLVKTENKDGKFTATLLSSNPRYMATSLESAKLEGKLLRFVFKAGTAEHVFEFTAPGAAKQAFGTFAFGTQLFPAEFAASDLKELAQADVFKAQSVPPMQQANTLSSRAQTLTFQAARETDATKKAQLLKDADAARKEAAEKTPALYQEVIDKHADSPAAFDAALALVRTAATRQAKPADVKATVETALKAAQRYGPRWQQEIAVRSAEALLNQEGFAALAAEFAARAEKNLTDKDAPATAARVLKTLKNALVKNGKGTEAKEVDGRLAKVEAALDAEYAKTVPPFKPTAFTGRKAKSERVAVMELFTGAQCPPCVAADVAFDALLKTYKPTDVVFLQYHMHIPGPDPLTNADTEARHRYYGEKFGRTMFGGTPSTLFNGDAQAYGGGGMANAENKFGQYRGLIDPLLETEATAKLKAEVARNGDKIDVKVDVALTGAGEDLKLRIAVVEESVRYVGGNNLRFHHHVVRSFAGGVNGFELKEKSSKHSASVDLAEVRKTLTAYLDNYSKTRAFPNPDRPLDLKNLRIIAFVQNDKTKEILQAAQVEVPESGK